VVETEAVAGLHYAQIAFTVWDFAVPSDPGFQKNTMSDLRRQSSA
jgi:hypothetical protein